MDRKPELLPEDLDQYERDYYDREMAKRTSGCLFSFKWLLILAILWTIGNLLLSCAATIPPATESTGLVTEVSGDMVWVLFDVVNRKQGDKASNWFCIPGHSYMKGDFYPDCSKDPALTCFSSIESP